MKTIETTICGWSKSVCANSEVSFPESISDVCKVISKSKENKKSNTVVVYPNGIAKKSMNCGLFSISPRIKKGSTIIVANKIEKQKKENETPVDWNKQIENAMLKVTAIMTLWLLIDRVNAQ